MQRYFAIDCNQASFVLTKDDQHHIVNVMRLKVDDKIEVVYQNELYEAQIMEQQPLVVQKVKKIPASLEKNNITLFVPLLREQKLDLLIQKATELGVGQIFFYQADHSIVKYQEGKLAKKLQRWRKICKEASEQSKRLTIPKLEFVTKETIGVFTGHKLLAHFDTAVTIKNKLKKIDACDTIGILIGPEGGFSQNELDDFTSNGFEMINLGAHVLRVETVPLFILSILKYEQMG